MVSCEVDEPADDIEIDAIDGVEDEEEEVEEVDDDEEDDSSSVPPSPSRI